MSDLARLGADFVCLLFYIIFGLLCFVVFLMVFGVVNVVGDPVSCCRCSSLFFVIKDSYDQPMIELKMESILKYDLLNDCSDGSRPDSKDSSIELQEFLAFSTT